MLWDHYSFCLCSTSGYNNFVFVAKVCLILPDTDFISALTQTDMVLSVTRIESHQHGKYTGAIKNNNYCSASLASVSVQHLSPLQLHTDHFIYLCCIYSLRNLHVLKLPLLIYHPVSQSFLGTIRATGKKIKWF